MILSCLYYEAGFLWHVIHKYVNRGHNDQEYFIFNIINFLYWRKRHKICTKFPVNTRAVWKVRGLTLFRVGTLWRCGDGLFLEVPPLASDAPLTTLHPLLENVLQTVYHFEISCLGAPFSSLEKPRNRMRRDLNWILCSAWKKWIGGTPLEHPPQSPDLVPCNFWAFPTMKRELRGKKFRSDQRSAARFREVGGAL
jgi:hypothetical protein